MRFWVVHGVSYPAFSFLTAGFALRLVAVVLTNATDILLADGMDSDMDLGRCMLMKFK